MNDVTLILSQIESGDPTAAEQLLPLVYDELRKLATAKLAQEKPGQTLQSTALVHEAFIRLVNTDQAQHWKSRGHFFAAAAESMRRILVENARRKKRVKRGGEWTRQAVELVHLRYFVGLSVDEAASLLGMSPRSADRLWSFARAWLHQEIAGAEECGEHFLTEL